MLGACGNIGWVKEPRPKKPSASFEARLEAARALRGQAPTPEVRAQLVRALGDRSNMIVEAAADAVAESEARELAPALMDAFDRLMVDPIASDKTCRGKIALARALVRLDADAARVFLVGLAHEQREPAWGPPVDTAAELRGHCALGLVRSRHPDAAALVAERLADPEPLARAAMARVLLELDQAVAVPLLRFKIRLGDDHADVIGACFASLLELTPGGAVTLAEAYLRAHDGASAEAVALALGESRRPEAFEVLRGWGEGSREARRVAFVAIALLRDDRGFDYLVEVVARDIAPAADEALAALGHFRHDQALVERALAAARTRDDAAFLARAHERLGR